MMTTRDERVWWVLRFVREHYVVPQIHKEQLVVALREASFSPLMSMRAHGLTTTMLHLADEIMKPYGFPTSFVISTTARQIENRFSFSELESKRSRSRRSNPSFGERC